MGFDAHKVHDFEGVDRFVSSVVVSLEHDDMFSIKVLGFLWIKMMAGGDMWEVLRENTSVYFNTVFEHEFCRVGAMDFVKSSQGPIFLFDVVDCFFKLLTSKLFV